MGIVRILGRICPAQSEQNVVSVLRYEAHYALPLGRKKGAKLTDAEEAVLNKKKYKERQKDAKVEQAMTDQFMGGRVLASISSRPGQCGRADGYILEGKELEFYLRKIKAKKGK